MYFKLPPMKNIIIVCISALCISTISYSQSNTEYNPKLFTKFSKKELKRIAKEFPDSVLFLNYIAEKGYYITEFPQKPIPHQIIENFTADKLENFNIFEYDVRFLENKNNYYKLGDTGKLLIIVSMKDIKQFSKQEKKNLK